MSDSVVSVYSDARSEYMKQLCLFLVPSYFQFYLNLLAKAREATKQDSKKLLWQFQTFLTDIPEWNNEKVTNEIQELQKMCGCDYLDDLLTAVFIAHTKVLTAIRVSSKQKKVQITVPKVEHFMFKVLCESSKLLWGSTYLFREDLSSIERQQNYRSIETLLQEGVMQAIRTMVPVKSILKDFVSSEDNGEEEAEAEAEAQEEAETVAEKSDVSGTPVAVASEPEPEPAPAPTPVPELESVVENTLEQDSSQPVIQIEDKPHVHFAPYDVILDEENPERSDLVSSADGNELNMIEGPPVSLVESDDFENLDQPEATGLEADEYEEL